MMHGRAISTVCAATFIFAVAVTGNQESSRALVPTEAEAPFFTYVKRTSPEPALVAFNPTHYDPRPETRQVPSLQSLQADLAALRPAFDGLILYGYDKDITPAVLAEATRQGYRAVVLGIWNPTSEEEIVNIATLAVQYRKDLALAVCIGNEGIMFHRYTANDLKTAALKFKQLLPPGVQIPITTSESFGEYGQLVLQEYGDFLAPNIHPVFDRPELGPVDAVDWVRERALALADSATKPLLVKETGFPHGGDPRFTPETQQAFWAAYVNTPRFVQVSTTPNVWISYAAAFEAVDLPWKAEMTGMPIEQAWGLLNTERQPFPAFFVWQNLRTPS